MLLEIYLPDKQVIDLHARNDTGIFDAFNNGNHRTTLVNANGDDNDVLIESTTLQSGWLHWFWTECASPRSLTQLPTLQCPWHHYSKSKGTSESCWCLKIPEGDEGWYCGGRSWQDDFHRESQHCCWESTTEGDTSFWVSSCESAQNKCLVMAFLTVSPSLFAGWNPLLKYSFLNEMISWTM